MVMRFQRKNCRGVMRFQRGKLLWGDAFSAGKTAQILMGIVENSSIKPPGVPGAIYGVLEVPGGDPGQQRRLCAGNWSFLSYSKRRRGAGRIVGLLGKTINTPLAVA